jgi:hypothetical protein
LTRVEQVQNILEVMRTIQCFGKKVRVSDRLLGPSGDPGIPLLLRTRAIR